MNDTQRTVLLEELAAVQKEWNEYTNQLDRLYASINQYTQRIDALAQRIEEIEDGLEN